MRYKMRYMSIVLPVILLVFWVMPATAEVLIQCPCLQLDANGKPDPAALLPLNGEPLQAGHTAPAGIIITTAAAYNAATQNIECKYTLNAVPHNAACKALSAGDGHVKMGDGNDIYIFGFDDMTGVPTNQVMNFVTDPTFPGGMRGAEASAPTINVQGGQELYLSLTNVSMFERPDLVDPHTVHYHGFPNASSVFDGEPMASISINMEQTLTYYYNNVEPGTYMWHCHVEASEHMQMGMLGSIYVRPQQDGTSITYNGKTYTNFAYNDCPVPGNPSCGTTGYDVGYPIEVTAMDPKFHHADNSYNLVDFAAMNDTYQLFNGRGYPDTINPCTNGKQTPYPIAPANYPQCQPGDPNQIALFNSLGVPSQNVSPLIVATHGQKILLHMPSLATSDFNTIATMGLPMQIIGQGARQHRGPTGLTYYTNSNSFTYGGGEAYDILLDTSTVSPGTYFLYTTNLNFLSNDAQDFGGLMTEIVIN